jgi:energy-coupling factor transporter ATP-binding protein EcfA2
VIYSIKLTRSGIWAHLLVFRYGDGEPWALRNISLAINPAESVAIAGPSGCGKTRLVKLILCSVETDIRRNSFGSYPKELIHSLSSLVRFSLRTPAKGQTPSL